MAELTTLPEAVAGLVGDGDLVALEGFTHLIPFAAGHEIIRQGRRRLTLARLTPDVIYDQLVGMGCAERLIFSWGGNPGVGSLHRLRDAVEHGWPAPLALEEHSHAGMANRYVAGASGLPMAVLRGYRGTDLGGVTASFCTPVMPHSMTLPDRSACWAWMTATSGLRAATAVSSSPVNGQVTVATEAVTPPRSVPR